MNISLNWLKEYLKIDLSVEKVCEILTLPPLFAELLM